MNVNVVVTVGAFICDVTITECGPDAVGDVLHQLTVHTLTMVGTEAIRAAAGSVEGPDNPTEA
jgi:hypothetical protein